MAKPIKHYVECPECQGQMGVADKSVGANRVPMVFGHCKGCGHMMQGKKHQEYLKQPLITESEPVVEVEEFEDFDPNEIKQVEAVQVEEETAPAVAERKGGFKMVLIGLGITGLALLGVGTAVKLLPSS